METAVTSTPYYKGADKEIYRGGNKGTTNFFEDLAAYIIVNNDKNETVPNDKIQVGHTWAGDHKKDEEDKCWLQTLEDNVKPIESGFITGNDDAQRDEVDGEKYEWKPGFCLQLGSQGRKAMLQLLRNVYKGNKNFKNIFQNMDPPTTISNLPFFKISMLWELAHQLDVFDQAIAIHKIYGKVKSKTGKGHNTQNGQGRDSSGSNSSVTKSPKAKRMKSPSFNSDRYRMKLEGDGLRNFTPNDGMQNLKRKMEHLVASKKVTPEQFAKFMGSYKHKRPFAEVIQDRIEKNVRGAQAQQNNLYDYIPRINKHTYPCNTLDCAIIHH
ncbi:hypothetical protein BaOVIS_011230 [Babesia ovis]|uniref:Uncharacterized protein n=1 Tax=Babesia ovis TaxID=5869 RepID=A0A9W5T928_BABOV|nr:hypothetical protein BaOVIS_011230 [Babesia ovis]